MPIRKDGLIRFFGVRLRAELWDDYERKTAARLEQAAKENQEIVCGEAAYRVVRVR